METLLNNICGHPQGEETPKQKPPTRVYLFRTYALLW